MLAEIGGLPAHPLFVHAAVVLVPLVAVATVVIVSRTAWRRSLGWSVVVLSAVATAAVWLTAESGEALANKVGVPIGHASLGQGLPYFAVAQFLTLLLFVGVAALSDWQRRRAAGRQSVRSHVAQAESVVALVPGGTATPPAGVAPQPLPTAARERMPLLVRVLAGVAVLFGVLATIQTIRVGDSGARAVWGDRLAATAQTEPMLPTMRQQVPVRPSI